MTTLTDKKYTDAEIVSSLEVIATTRNCSECKIRNCKWGTCNCSQITANAALDLINRQTAEIERLKKDANLVSIQFQDVQERTEEYRLKIEKQIKAEAYKDFAENLEIEINYRTTLSREQDKNVIHIIHNLLKEMVEDEIL